MAFHLYPQLIPQLFNVGECGPPRRFTAASAWPWVAHSVSGLVSATLGLRPRPIRTRFRCGSGRQALTSPHPANSPDHSSIGTPSGYRLRGNTLRLLVGTRFQFLFHSPPGVLFTFPSRYSFAIGRQRYLALDSGLPSFPLWRPSEWYSRYRPEVARFRIRGSHPLRRAVPGTFS